MYTLYWSRNTGAMAPQALLEELGLDYRLAPVDIAAKAHQAPAFVALNPMAQVPALGLPDGSIMTESAAMVLYLADLHPGSGLSPPPADGARPAFLRWLLFMAVNVYGADLRWSYPARYTHGEDGTGADGVAAAGRHDAERYFAAIESLLAEGELGAGPFFLGQRYSALDPYLLMLAGWHFDVDGLRARCPHIARLMDATLERPAVAHVWASHGLR